LALSLGESGEPDAGQTLRQLALANLDDRWVRAAVLSSAGPHLSEIFRVLAESTNAAAPRLSLAGQLIASAVDSSRQFNDFFLLIAGSGGTPNRVWHFGLLTAVLDTLERKGQDYLAYA